MKTLVTTALFAIAVSSAMQAQETPQTGDSVYTDRVIGENGIAYNCRAEPIIQNGQPARSCVRADNGLAGEGAISTPAAGGVILLALGAAVGGSSSSTTTTTTD